MWIFISALAVDSVQACHLFITIKYLHSFSHQESSVCIPRETGEWIFAVRIWAKQEARICKLQVPSAFHTDRLPEEDLFAQCNMEWCSSHMCKRYLFNRLLGPHFLAFIQKRNHAFIGRVCSFSLSNTYPYRPNKHSPVFPSSQIAQWLPQTRSRHSCRCRDH